MAKFTLNVASSSTFSIWSNSAQFQSAYIRRLRQHSFDIPGHPTLGFSPTAVSARRVYDFPQPIRNDATRTNAPISS